MSKSLDNYIGITEPAGEMFGKVMSITDDLMLRYYELLSHISTEALEKLKSDMKGGNINPKHAKEDLGVELVERYWGEEAAQKARAEFSQVFKEGQLPSDIPVAELAWGEPERWIADIMKEGGLAKSTSEAMRLVKQGGVKVDGKKLDDPKAALPPPPKGEYLIQVGKRKFLKVSVKK
jgi:tyrosyl-tRNA synthetase